MAKGLDKHKERIAAIQRLGKDLARRSKSACELCGSSGVPLSAYEVPPVVDEPTVEQCLFACDECNDQLANPKRIRPEHWRCLTTTIWSDLPAAQVVAARILERLSANEAWAAEILDEAYFDEEVESWVKAERF